MIIGIQQSKMNYLIKSAAAVVVGSVMLNASVRAEPFVAPELPKIPSSIFNVKQYGAVGDEIATNTAAIQAAIEAATKAGGGIVEVPAGVYLSGPIHLASQINLRVDDGATLRMLPIEKYPGGTTDPENFISGSNL